MTSTDSQEANGTVPALSKPQSYLGYHVINPFPLRYYPLSLRSDERSSRTFKALPEKKEERERKRLSHSGRGILGMHLKEKIPLCIPLATPHFQNRQIYFSDEFYLL
jgi:hypothetical protein